MRFLDVVMIVTIGACSGSSQNKNEPLAGTINGASFEAVGSYAETRNGTMYVTIANKASSCGAFLQPSASLVRVDLTIPAQALNVGAHPLGSGDAAPRVAVTSFSTDANGMLHQSSIVVETGALDVHDIGTSISGALTISASQAVLSGTFTADLCQ